MVGRWKRAKRGVLLALAVSMAASSLAIAGSPAGASVSAKKAKPDPTATLKVAQNAVSSIWDPVNTTANSGVDYTTMGPVYDRLLLLGPKLTVEPMLAESYSLSNNNRTLTFKLRKDVTFHDGTPFNADVVLANINFRKASPNTPGGRAAAVIAAAAAVDPYTVRLDLSDDGTNLPVSFASLMSLGAMVSPKALADPATLKTTPSGSGPYKRVDQLQDRVIFEKNPNYWDKEYLATAPARIEMIVIIDENARLAALQAGQVDMIPISSVIPDLDSILAKGIQLSVGKGNGMFYMRVNLANPAIANADFRKALSLAIDRKALQTAGIIDTRSTISLTPMVPGTVGYTPKAEAPKYDLKKAQQLKTKSGVGDVTLKIETLTGNSVFVDGITAIAAMWAKIGVKAEITSLPAPNYSPEWTKGSFDTSWNSNAGSPDPYQAFQTFFMDPSLLHGTAPAELVALVDAAGRLPLGSKARDEAWQKVSIYLSKNPVMMMLASNSPKTLSRSDVKGAGLGFSQLTSSLDARFAVKMK